MNKQDLYNAMRNQGAKIVFDEATGLYTMNGEKLRKNSAEGAISDLGQYVESACVAETVGTQTTYSYKFARKIA